MNENDYQWLNAFEYDYIEAADILEIFFVQGAATSAVEIADDVVLRFDHSKQQAVSLILNNYTYLVQPAQFGPRSFKLNIDHLAPFLQETVLQIMSQPPVNRVIKMLTYATSSSSRAIPIAAIEPV